FAYDASGKIKRVQDSGGRITSFTVLTPPGNLTRVQTPAGYISTLSYDTSNRLTRLLNPSGQRLTIGYGAFATYGVSSVTTPNGQQTQYTSTMGFPPVSVTDPQSFRSTLTFTGQQIQRVRDPQGGLTTFTWSSSRLQSLRAPVGRRVILRYHPITPDNTPPVQTIMRPGRR